MNTDPRRTYFDNLADTWDEEGPSAEEMIRRLDDSTGLLRLRPDTTLLEVGCGTGKTTGWLAEQVHPGRVTALDFAPLMIDEARKKGIDADWLCLDVCSHKIPAGPFDVVLCFHCFPHFRDQPAALRNLVAAMKPDGRLIVMHLKGSRQINDFHASLQGAVQGDHLPEGEEWTPLLGNAGLVSTRHIDRDDLFFLETIRSSATGKSLAEQQS